MPTPHSLFGRYIHLAGSANRNRPAALVCYAHELLRDLTIAILAQGGGLVLFAGKEPLQDEAVANSPALTFDWTILETVDEVTSRGKLPWPHTWPPIVVVTSEKATSEIPQKRRALWDRLLGSGLLRVDYIQPGARSGALLRERQAQFGTVFVCMGGGTGVEHLADLYQSRQRPVIPLDIDLGASRDDGIGGSARMHREAMANPNSFLRLNPQRAASGAALLAAASTQNGSKERSKVVGSLMQLLGAIDLPKAFYIRMLNEQLPEFPMVERFFREIVDPVIESIGYRRIEMGTDPTEHGFINAEIFERLHYSELAIADVTGLRSNCFIELGYALGHQIPVIVTAKKETELPFDQDAIPCHFWNPDTDVETSQLRLLEFIERNIGRPSLVA